MSWNLVEVQCRAVTCANLTEGSSASFPAVTSPVTVQTALLKARPNLAGPKVAEGSCPATCREPTAAHSISVVQCRTKRWKVLTARLHTSTAGVQDSVSVLQSSLSPQPACRGQ